MEVEAWHGTGYDTALAFSCRGDGRVRFVTFAQLRCLRDARAIVQSELSLDPRWSNAGMYGYALYFAENASHSDTYFEVCKQQRCSSAAVHFYVIVCLFRLWSTEPRGSERPFCTARAAAVQRAAGSLP